MKKFEKFRIKEQRTICGGANTKTTWTNTDGSESGCDTLLSDGSIAYHSCC